MGLLKAGVTNARIRVSVAITSTGDTTNATQLNKLQSVVQYVLPAAALEWVHIVMGVAPDSVGYNRFIHEYEVVSDQAVLGVTKNLFESQTVADEATYVLFKKGLLEAQVTTEVRTFSMAKALFDVVDATDDFMGLANTDDEQVMVFSKTLSVEALSTSDQTTAAVGKQVTDTVEKSDLLTAEVGKGLTENLGTTEERTNSFEKSLSDTVDAGDEFNAVATTDDGEVLIFGKTLDDEFTQSDFTSVQAEKGLQDDQITSDQIDTIEVGKGLEDVPVTSELLGFAVDKVLLDDAVPTDLVSFGLGLGFADRAYYGDGPNNYPTYAIDYFADTYALEGFPAIDFFKGIFDTVHTTDDFFGVANTDDDEVMQFGKTLNELFQTVDSARFSYSKAIVDLVSKDDSAVFSIGKALADSFGKFDLATKATGKALSDSSFSSDAALRNIGKGIGDEATTAEYNSFVLQKRITDSVVTTDDFLGNANADDDETMLLGKVVSDSFTKSDSVSIGAGKGLADLASTSESGSIVWTDYWPIGYTDTTSGVYVGTRRTF